MGYVFRAKLPRQKYIGCGPVNLQNPWLVKMVNIVKIGRLWFNTFSPLSDPRRAVNNELKNLLPPPPLSLKGSAALAFIAQFDLFICL